jgi:hypothetical protein
MEQALATPAPTTTPRVEDSAEEAIDLLSLSDSPSDSPPDALSDSLALSPSKEAALITPAATQSEITHVPTSGTPHNAASDDIYIVDSTGKSSPTVSTNNAARKKAAANGIATLTMKIHELAKSNARLASPLRAILQCFQELHKTHNGDDTFDPCSESMEMKMRGLLPLRAVDAMRLEYRSSTHRDYMRSWYNEDLISNLVKTASANVETTRVFGCPAHHAWWANVSMTVDQRIDRLCVTAMDVDANGWNGSFNAKQLRFVPQLTAKAEELILPVNTGNHWATVVARPDLTSAEGSRRGQAIIYDSCNDSGEKSKLVERLVDPFLSLIGRQPGCY